MHGHIPKIWMVPDGYPLKLREEVVTLHSVHGMGPVVVAQLIQLFHLPWVHGKALWGNGVQPLTIGGKIVHPTMFGFGCIHS